MLLTDRTVQEVSLAPKVGNGSNPFSAYLEFPSIVLLGDPGAGKTHLFSEFARHEETQALVARSFLNRDIASLGKTNTLYIDALDERRAGRGDGNAVDQIVQKLFLVKPRKVRIACRAADWLGETDLAAFRDFFAENGECVVLALQPLSEAEQIDVLVKQGVKDPTAFLAEAQSKLLGDLLGNPQNLTMLAEVVGKRDWPNSRTELFSQAVDILLTEHNHSQASRSSGRYSPNELLDVAGEICAVRLISDIQAISLTEHNHCDDLPSYRYFSSVDKDKVLAALGRRVFVSALEVGTVDYAHRTVAEYLGALWIAKQIGHGLPIGRVRALIGVDGRPPSELRGLHAWLASKLQADAHALISADPFGVLSYGDAKALSPSLRNFLLSELAKLSEVDPWFREGNWSSAAVASLAGPDMVVGFRKILVAENANFSLRTLVLDALTAGQPIPELLIELQQLAGNSLASYAERRASVDALYRLGEPGNSALTVIYKAIGTGAEDLCLKAKILKNILGKRLGIEAFTTLFCDVFLCKSKVPFDVLYHLSDNVTDSDVCTALNLISENTKTISSGGADVWGLDREFDSLLHRALTMNTQIDGETLLTWLECRHKVANHDYAVNVASMQRLVADFPAAIERTIDAALRRLMPSDSIPQFIYHLRELGITNYGDALLLNCCIRQYTVEANAAKKDCLFELALYTAIQGGVDALTDFNSLLESADGHPTLEEIRQRCCYQEIPEWRVNDALRNQEQVAKKEAAQRQNRANFKAHIGAIKSGKDLGWLGWIAEVYFGMAYGLNRDATPFGRIVEELGADDALIAIEGLIALVQCGTIPAPAELLQKHIEGKYHRWWYAVLAGLDEYVAAVQPLLDLGDSYLVSALMIDSLCVTSTYKGNVSSQFVHPWKTMLLRERPELVLRANLALARADLARNFQNAYGLHELLNNAELSQYRPAVALTLLQEFPTAHVDSLRQLVQVAICECDADQVTRIFRKGIADGFGNDDVLTVWLAAGYLISATEFGSYCDALDELGKQKLIWELRALSGRSRRNQQGARLLSCQQMEQIIDWVMSQFSRTSHPEGVSVGDTNAWDATEFALKLIADISSETSEDAAKSLNRISALPHASGYLDDVKHAIAQQRILRTETQFHQPSFEQVAAALSNGKPANIADLHALMMWHLDGLRQHITSANIDVFKQFWNTDRYDKKDDPKSEGVCRDALVGLLQARTSTLQITIDPEGHMANDKRADIVAILPGMKLVFELKRDYHTDVWDAIQTQLERLYTRDPDASGFGIYLVFWFGDARGSRLPNPPSSFRPPKTAEEMQDILRSLVTVDQRDRIGVVVLDVSGEIPAGCVN
jgi:hypothetical protein